MYQDKGCFVIYAKHLKLLYLKSMKEIINLKNKEMI